MENHCLFSFSLLIFSSTVPEGVHPPVLEANSFFSLKASWKEPDQPNGVIVSYTLHMRNITTDVVLYQGLRLSHHVTGLFAGQEYFFYIMANTSVGGTQSSVVSASLPLKQTEPSKCFCTTQSWVMCSSICFVLKSSE